MHPSCYSTDRDSDGGVPVVLLEAQATGLPNYYEVPSEVIYGVTGTLVGEVHVQALAQAIVDFYEMSPEKYQEYSKSARLHVPENFCVKKNTTLNLIIYQDIIGASNGSPRNKN